MQEQKKFMAGNSDFLSLQAGGYYYVDKTLLIRELLDHPAMVTLITRPRRFGKTLNMSMLQTFFEMNSGGEAYFRELNIGRCGRKIYEALRRLSGDQPFFKGCKRERLEQYVWPVL